MQQIVTEVASHGKRPAGTEVLPVHHADQLHQRHREHPAADPEDVSGVAFGDTVVDDVGIERR